MYLCVRGIDVASFYHISIGFGNRFNNGSTMWCFLFFILFHASPSKREKNIVCHWLILCACPVHNFNIINGNITMVTVSSISPDVGCKIRSWWYGNFQLMPPISLFPMHRLQWLVSATNSLQYKGDKYRLKWQKNRFNKIIDIQVSVPHVFPDKPYQVRSQPKYLKAK